MRIFVATLVMGSRYGHHYVDMVALDDEVLTEMSQQPSDGLL